MLFNSLIFLFVFLPITLLGFALFGRIGGATAWLLFASLVFYAYWKPVYLALVIISILFNYAAGRWLMRESNPPRLKRAILAGTVAANLGLLGYYKYAGWFMGTVSTMTGVHVKPITVVLPLAISFYTFTEIAYLVDLYRGKILRHSFLDFCLFVTFFPHLIAGPIVRSHEILPQITGRKWRLERGPFAIGITLFILGLFKKSVLADALASYVNPVFAGADSGLQISFLEAWIGALAYTLQIYFDFSGYSDMAIGLAHMFGVKFPMNFNSPYQATSIIDFWRRWHITLSRFLRDYLYIPLGGNRKGKFRQYVNLSATMLLGGLWHGASWTFVFWGGLHGAYLAVNHGYRDMSRRSPELQTLNRACPSIFGWGITFLVVVVGWVFFRASHWEAALSLLASMAGLHGLTIPPGYAGFHRLQPMLAHFGFTFTGVKTLVNLNQGLLILFGGLLLAWFFPNPQQWMVNYHPVLEPDAEYRRPLRFYWKPTLAIGFTMGILFFFALKTFFKAVPSAFLYFNF